MTTLTVVDRIDGCRHVFDRRGRPVDVDLRDALVSPETCGLHPRDPLRHEILRRKLAEPGAALESAPRLLRDGIKLRDDEPLPADEATIHLARALAPAEPHAIDMAAWHRDVFARHRASLTASITGVLGCPLPDAVSPAFIERAARAVHRAPFENITRLASGVGYRSGFEMWQQIALGRGGVCGEKVFALRFLFDILGATTHLVIATPVHPPDDLDARIATVSEGAPLPLPIDHLMLEVELDGQPILVDATGGALPLIVRRGDDADALRTAGLTARMLYTLEHMHLRRVSPRSAELLLSLGTFRTRTAAWDLVFAMGTGLILGAHRQIGVHFDWGGRRSAQIQQHIAHRARCAGCPPPKFLRASALLDRADELLPGPLAIQLPAAIQGLHRQCARPEYSGEFLYVLQTQRHRWRPGTHP